MYPSPLQPPCLARVVNLSAEGCRLVFQDPLDLEREALVEIVFTVNQLPFRVRAQVRALISGTTVGFAFVHLSGRLSSNLRDLIDELAERKSAARA